MRVLKTWATNGPAGFALTSTSFPSAFLAVRGRRSGGEQLVEWGGALRWLVGGERTDPARIRAWAKEQGGHATLFAGADKSAGVFQPLPAPVLALHERLKAGFDPHGILNPGRLYASF